MPEASGGLPSPAFALDRDFHMPTGNHNTFESDEFLLRIDCDHLLYAEKSEVCFDFRNIARLRIHRRNADGGISRITYRVRGELTSFQIDGFTDAEMQSIASLLKARATAFSIPVTDPGT
ncbi:MAG: hypothetical protein IPH09_12540 [bacterium]|nr:hypothetical protein [bacterium]